MHTEELHESNKVDVLVQKITDGLGYGVGAISHVDRRDEVGAERLQTVETLLNSNEILVPVDVDKDGKMLDDDGCGDGRKWKRIFAGVTQKFKSLHRSKVFGGGITMGVASKIGLGRVKGLSLNQVFDESIGTFQDRMIGFGAHTDDHAHGDNCGCGAIDKAPIALQNALMFEAEIRGSVAATGVDTEGIDEVYDNFRAYVPEIADQPYTGRQVMDGVVNAGQIVKELTDDHKEMYILLNMVENMTVDQEAVRRVSDEAVQVFAVDVWRMKQLAERLYDTPAEQQRAFISELVYTLAVAATLTKGDLPVYSITPKPVLQAA